MMPLQKIHMQKGEGGNRNRQLMSGLQLQSTSTGSDNCFSYICVCFVSHMDNKEEPHHPHRTDFRI